MGRKREKKEIPKKSFENSAFCEQGKKKKNRKTQTNVICTNFWGEFSFPKSSAFQEKREIQQEKNVMDCPPIMCTIKKE